MLPAVNVYTTIIPFVVITRSSTLGEVVSFIIRLFVCLDVINIK